MPPVNFCVVCSAKTDEGCQILQKSLTSEETDTREIIQQQSMISDGLDTRATMQQLCERIQQLEAVCWICLYYTFYTVFQKELPACRWL